jgi:hypothetical protein
MYLYSGMLELCIVDACLTTGIFTDGNKGLLAAADSGQLWIMNQSAFGDFMQCTVLPESMELNEFLPQKDIIVLHCNYQSELRY